MNLSDSKRQKTAKRPHAFLRAVCDNLWGLSDRVLLERVPTSDEPCTVDVAPGEKPYESPSRTIWNAKDPVICKLFGNLGFSLTVKTWHGWRKDFYRQISRQNVLLDADSGRKRTLVTGRRGS